MRMIEKLRHDYHMTIYACYLGYISQAIVNNFAPLLFVVFAAEYGLSLAQITFITTMNFSVQLMVDLLSVKVIDRLGYRASILIAHVCAAAGLIGLGILPEILGDAYIGILISAFIYAVGGGIIEVLISPIVEACPTDNKEAFCILSTAGAIWRSS